MVELFHKLTARFQELILLLKGRGTFYDIFSPSPLGILKTVGGGVGPLLELLGARERRSGHS